MVVDENEISCRYYFPFIKLGPQTNRILALTNDVVRQIFKLITNYILSFESMSLSKSSSAHRFVTSVPSIDNSFRWPKTSAPQLRITFGNFFLFSVPPRHPYCKQLWTSPCPYSIQHCQCKAMRPLCHLFDPPTMFRKRQSISLWEQL
jgi:hypothetical protein